MILADLGHDPTHWPSKAATAADHSDDRGAPAFGGRDSGRPIGCSGGRSPRRKGFFVGPRNHQWRSVWWTHDINEHVALWPRCNEATRPRCMWPRSHVATRPHGYELLSSPACMMCAVGRWPSAVSLATGGCSRAWQMATRPSSHVAMWPRGQVALWKRCHVATLPRGHVATWPSGHVASRRKIEERRYRC